MGDDLGAPAPTVRLRIPTFGAFRHRSFRIFFAGYVVSLVGIWMQRVAQAWLVLDLTGSAFYVGLVEALGTLPVLLFSLYAGAVADRMDRRILVIATQIAGMLLGFAFAAVVFLDLATIEIVMVIATLVGIATAFDIPARHSFFYDLVGKEDIANAIALNSSAFNATRVVGPSIAGFLIGAAGVGVCFLLNGLSFLAVLTALFVMGGQGGQGSQGGRGVAAWTRIKEGLAYVATERRVRLVLINIAVLSIFGLPVLVLIPVLTRNVLGLGAREYGWMMSAVGVGAVIGALALATFARRIPKGRVLGWTGAAFGLLVAVVGFARPLWLVLTLLTVIGLAMIVTTALTNTLLQTIAPDELRGRVVSVYTFAFLGMAPIGAFQAGVVAERFGVEIALLIGGMVTAAAAVLVVVRSWDLRATP